MRPPGTHLGGLPLLALMAALSPAHAQQDSVTRRVYDVRALQSMDLERRPDGVDLRLPLATSFLDELEPESYDIRHEPEPRIVVSDWEDLLLELLGEREPDASFSAEELEGVLHVETDAATQARVEELLLAVESYALRVVELDVHVLSMSSLPAGTPTVLSPEAVEGLLASATPLHSARSFGRLGRRAVLSVESRSSALTDYDVEVAQKAVAADPQVTILRHSLSIGAIVNELSGGGLALRVWGRRGQPLEGRSVELEALGGASIELPSMSAMLVASSAEIPDGGGLLVTQDWNDDGAWLVRARVLGGPAPPEFLPLGGQVVQSMVVASPKLGSATPSGGFGSAQDHARAALGGRALVERAVLVERLAKAGEQLGLEGGLTLVGDAVYVAADALRAQAQQLIAEWNADTSAGTAVVELRAGLVESSETSRILASARTSSELAESLTRRLSGACRSGDSLLIVAGTESLYLMDFDVEIAEAATIADPILGALFSGASLWCRPAAMRRGGYTLWVDLACQASVGGVEQAPIVSWQALRPELEEYGPWGQLASAGAIEKVATARAQMRTVALVPDGEWALLGCEELGGTGSHLVAVVRVSSQRAAR